MKARRIEDIENPQEPTLRATIIARWWLGRYYLISTISFKSTYDSDSAHAKFMSALEAIKPSGSAPHQKPQFISQVFKCNGIGFVTDQNLARPLAEVEYLSLEDAIAGHTTIVSKFSGR